MNKLGNRRYIIGCGTAATLFFANRSICRSAA